MSACGRVAVALLGLVAFAGVASAELRVAVISDLNGSYGSTDYEHTVAETVRELIARAPDLVISTGDMVAGQRPRPHLERDEIEAMWSAFHELVTEPLEEAGIPFAVTPGNHDASAYASYSLEREIYAEQWRERMPKLQFVDSAEYPYRYAFRLDDILFVSLDVTTVGPIDDDERRWLDALLKAEAGTARERVVFSHVPIYAFAVDRDTETTADRALEELLIAHEVGFYLSGHHHAYYPGFAAGIRHVGQACLGAQPRFLIGSGTRSSRAVTWLELGAAEATVTGLIAPALEEAIDIQALPRAITSQHGTLVRDDLRPRGHAVTTTAVAD